MKPMMVLTLCCTFLLPACSRSNNLLLGRVETTLGTHTIVVTDCYRTSVPEPQTYKDSLQSTVEYRFVPCRDAAIIIRNEELFVNGTSYGLLRAEDAVTVDHGKVLINDRDAGVRR